MSVCSNCIMSHSLIYTNNCGTNWETKVESQASSETQPNQAALLLNTARIQHGSQPHQCVGGNTMHLATLVSVHCAWPATGVAGARWDKDIPTGQTLPNPDDARPIVRRPTDLPVADGWWSGLGHCATWEVPQCLFFYWWNYPGHIATQTCKTLWSTLDIDVYFMCM
jgi:hypothetical protein